MDLVDFVSAQGAVAGRNAAAFVTGDAMQPWVLSRLSGSAKGLTEPDALNCVVCPNGCHLRYAEDGSVSGARCPRGVAYAKQERTDPRRTLTLTMRTQSGKLVPVRTCSPIPKGRIMEAVQQLQAIDLPARDYHCGERVLDDLMGSAVIATADIPAGN